MDQLFSEKCSYQSQYIEVMIKGGRKDLSRLKNGRGEITSGEILGHQIYDD